MGGPTDNPPEISRIVDLGSLSIPAEGELSMAESDGRFISGEWAALVGTGLNADRARLYLDGAEVPVRGGLKGGGLPFRMPRDLKFRHNYKVSVETQHGKAEDCLVGREPSGDGRPQRRPGALLENIA